MTRGVESIPEGASVREAARRMHARNIGSLVVTRAGAAAGIVTERDLVQRVLASGRDADATRVGEVMSAPLVTIEPSASVDAAAALMAERRVKRLVVALGGEVHGIVTVTDVAHARPEISRRVLDSWIRQRWED